ncbi:hypothetical protein [Vibrio chagasii]|uniref:hypothetical protein n=1 Tax=Vibrio chagasii TaxID=170679 RepID=UPI001EFD6177|nr:hypothetical protein [Vibrio chagasii]MCG9569520.1 hypothetical protein [Vibrio chagasii]
MEQYLKSKLLIEEVEVLLTNSSSLFDESVACVVLSKHALTTLKNVFDFIKTLSPMYKSYPQLQTAVKAHYQELEFCNYLRNNISGHLNQSALCNLFKWRPELVRDLKSFDSSSSFYHFHTVVMAYVFNSYRDKKGCHLFYKEESLSDVEYDFPKMRRFIIDALEGAKFSLQIICSILKLDFDTQVEAFDFEGELVSSLTHTITKL